LARPLFDSLIQAENAKAALASVAVSTIETGDKRPLEKTSHLTLYTEELEPNAAPLRLRDVPIPGPRRQFGVRTVSIVHLEQGGGDVPQ
jgi:hypothetical protein